MKRTIYFLATNIAVVLVLSVTMRLLGVEPYLNANGLDLSNLLMFAAIMGFGGAFISLAISKTPSCRCISRPIARKWPSATPGCASTRR